MHFNFNGAGILIIRDLNEDDIPTLIKWLHDFSENFEYPGKRPIDDEVAALFFSRFIGREGQGAFVAEVNNRPVATMGFSVLPHPWTGETVLYKAFWYSDNSVQGMGTKLLRYLRGLCERADISQIIIGSMHNGVSRLLEREGFKPVEMNYTLVLK